MSLAKILGDVDGIISDFVFSGFLDLAFLFIEEILYNVQKGSESILSYISSQTLEVSPANNDMVDL